MTSATIKMDTNVILIVAAHKLTTALEFVREGDVLVVTKPEPPHRSTRNLLDIVEDLEKRGTRLFNATSARAKSCAVADHG